MTREEIQPFFAMDVPDFCKKILDYLDKDSKFELVKKYLDDYIKFSDIRRQTEKFRLNEGVIEFLNEVNDSGLKIAVVSNTNQKDLLRILENSGLRSYFETIVGNDLKIDGKLINKKPAPDAYILAASKLGVDVSECVVLEDTVIGATAGKRAGCYVIGVSTGGESFENLLNSEFTDDVVESLT